MSDDTASDRGASGPIHVLHVDDDPDFVERAATVLERADDRFAVETEASVRAGLGRLETDAFDCVVSDYEMPHASGIEFLETVRETYPTLPFILFTGRGSETVASEAISAGVTDYLQKDATTQQYELLANRIANVVEAHRSRQLLGERTRRLETLISNLPGIVYRCRNEPEWPMEIVEGEIERLTGYTADQLAAGELTWGDDVLHPADADAVWKSIQRSLANDGTFEVTYRIVTADGATKWMWERGRMVDVDSGGSDALEGFITDITERKERERELERRTEELEELTDELEEQYRHLFEEAPVMAVVTRAEDGRPIVDDCNHRVVETLDYDRDEIVGEELATFYTPASVRKLLGGGYKRALAGEFMSENRELVTAEDEVVETLLRAVPRRDARDEIVGTLALYIDVSERKALERQATRLEEFASIVSHDLRNPLNVAQTRTKLARQETGSPHLDDAVRAHERMAALIEDLLTLARLGDRIAETESVALGHFVERCWADAPTADATLRVETDRTVRADRSRLRQLVENLVRNSVEHGSTSSRPTTDDAGVAVTVGNLADGFYVADDGTGIPEADRDDVFEAGYSTADAGTGFGLRIVEQVADAHGWTVDVTESADGGARFEIRGVEFGA